MIGVSAYAIATIPLRLVLGDAATQAGVSAHAVEGTLWSGTLRGAAFRGVPLGDLRLRTHVWPLLTGQWQVSLQSDAGPLRRATVGVSGKALSLRQVEGRVPVSFLVPGANWPGGLSLSNVALERDKAGTCVSASGTARWDALETWGGPALSGTLRCEGGQVVLPMAGSADMATVKARLSLSPAAQARLQVEAESHSPAMSTAAALMGMTEQAPGLWILDRTAP
ncbi:MAG: type II secretion system protein N [Asticcacaulis sp.]